MNVLKTGEEGIVSLQDFSLDGARRSGLRYALSRGERDGLDFEFVPASRVSDFLEAIEQISNVWLTKHAGGGEKHFSVAAFERFFVSCQSLAIVRQHGRLIAFATIMTTELKETATVGLMRYRPDAASRYVMEFLFVSLLLHLRAQGYRKFSLGVAPLSGLRSHSLANSWHHIGSFIWAFSRRLYNFKGLRSFKSKFDPVWEPRYIAASGSLGTYMALLDIASLVAGGIRRARRREAKERGSGMRVPISICLVLGFCLLAARPAASAVDMGNLGQVHIFKADGNVRDVVVLFSDRGGWGTASNGIATALAQSGALVLGVDLPSYLNRLDQHSNESCHRAVADIDFVGPQIEREQGIKSYLTPVVAGVGEGGTLAEAILAQAPPVTIAAAVSLDPVESISTHIPLCSDAPTERRPDGSFTYGAGKTLPGRWVVGFIPAADPAGRRQVEKLSASGTPVKIVPLAANVSIPKMVAGLVQSALPDDPQRNCAPAIGRIADAPSQRPSHHSV